MSALFEELDFRPTPMGALILRRRRDLARAVDVFEIKLGDDFLMTSLHTASEIALGALGLAPLAGKNDLAVIVGGLGLGHTAKAVLDNRAVGSLVVVDALDAVIDWHKEGLLPLSDTLTGDPRCQLLHADFFDLASKAPGAFALANARCQADAILVDIDHAPDNLLSPSHAGFYTPAGLQALGAHLAPGGVFGLWSNDPPDDAFVAVLDAVFASPEAHVVRFANAAGDGEVSCTVYLARKPAP